MAGDILSDFRKADVAKFRDDFVQMIKVGKEIDRYYREAHGDLDIFIPKYEKLSAMFNRKYKGLKIRAKKGIDEFKVQLFVKSNDIKEFFSESASKIPGLRSIGKSDFDQFDLTDPENLKKYMDSVKDSIYLIYADPESGSGTIGAVYEKKENMIELAYNTDEICNENSAGFRICAYYALKGGFDGKADIISEASTFGFVNLLDEAERREWNDRFNPGFLE